ncbi:carboxylesterase [Kribbella aluminosa]|uniref:Carboxylesterase n=1 Tax=Kribbella aluminosa TaxID=416017 RepID=A0ABS4UWZ0_9ACTN|nr:alpha/beta fold hydrolase [Kribbella aluminosa]MBP2356146.1 carboxylesterase [Kribbella aluminosa]
MTGVAASTAAYHVDGDSVGVLVCHGFAGSGLSVRPWAEAVATAGHTVALPLLPGHGTCWQDLEQTTWTDWYDEVERALLGLRDRCTDIFVFGFSMGGALALRLAQRHPDLIAGLVLVNPAIATRDWRIGLIGRLPALTRLVRTAPGIGGDVRKPGVGETGYEVVPTRAVHELTLLWRAVRADLAAVRAPTLVYRSRIDHVVDDSSVDLLRSRLPTRPVIEVLEHSYHVATLDNDASTIIDGSLTWLAKHRPRG